MKISVNTKEAKKAFTIFKDMIKKTNASILQNVLIETGEGEATFTCFNLEGHVVKTIPCVVHEPGKGLVDIVYTLCRLKLEDELNYALEGEIGGDTSKFPAIPYDDSGFNRQLPVNLVPAIKDCLVCVAKDDHINHLDMIFIEFTGDEAIVTSSDSFSLVMVKIECSFPAGKFAIKAAEAKLIAKILNVGLVFVSVIDGGFLRFENGSNRVTVRVRNEFRDIAHIVKKNHGSGVIVDRKGLLSVAKKMQAFDRSHEKCGNTRTKMKTVEDKVGFTSQDNVTLYLDCECQAGNSIKFLGNMNSVIDFLKRAESEEVEIVVESGEKKPMTIFADNKTFMSMPIKK